MNSGAQNFRRAFLMLALLLPLSAWMPGYAHAKYLMPHLQEVPIKRLLTNLEEQVRKKPDDAWLRLNQARAYAMAYALWRPKVPESIYFSLAFLKKFRLRYLWVCRNPC